MRDVVVARPVEIRGRRVRLRLFREGEFDSLRDELAVDADWAPNLGAPGAWERLRERVASSGMWGPTELLLAVEGDGRLAGDIQARHSNEIMDRVLESVGFRFEGVLRGFMPPPADAGAEPEDYAMYGITKRDHAALDARTLRA